MILLCILPDTLILHQFMQIYADSYPHSFKGLYSQELLKLAAFKHKIGDLDDHYQNFMRENSIGKCPFCGIADMHGIYHSKREAYDHYLPKSLYPFNSINLKIWCLHVTTAIAPINLAKTLHIHPKIQLKQPPDERCSTLTQATAIT